MKTSNIALAAPPSNRRREAVKLFTDLLGTKTVEADWQKFFTANPFIFSDALQVSFDGLYSHLPLVSGIPDYVFHRTTGPGLGDYGVIELKRPTDSIIGQYSSRIVMPSRKLAVAERQVGLYLESLRRGQFVNSSDFFAVGTRRYAFIIMGTNAELTDKFQNEIIRDQFGGLLPTGFNLYTYDEILTLFAATVPPLVQVLFVSNPYAPSKIYTATLTLVYENGLHMRPAAMIARVAHRFRSVITIANEDDRANAREIMSLEMLGSLCGARLTITADGPDAREAIEAVAQCGPFTHRTFDPPVTVAVPAIEISSLQPKTYEYQLAREFADAERREYAETAASRRKDSIRRAAFQLASADGFRAGAEEYWVQAEQQCGLPTLNSEEAAAIGRHDRIETAAYFLAEADGFKNPAFVYWAKAEEKAFPNERSWRLFR